MAARNLAWATLLGVVGLAAQGGARFLHTTWVGNTAPDRLGTLSALLSISVFLTLLGPAAAGIAAGRFAPAGAPRGPELLQALSTAMLWTGGGLTLVTAVVAATVTGPVGIVTCCALVLGYGAYLYCRGALIGSGRVMRAAGLDIATAVLTVLAVWLVVSHQWWDALLLPPTVGYLAFALLARPRPVRAGATEEERRTLRSFLVTNSVAQMATGALVPATMLCVEWFDRPGSSAFAAALALATPPNMIAQALLLVLVPHFATAPRTAAGGVARRHVLTLLGVSALLWVLLFGTMVLIAPQLLDLVYPGKFPEAADTLRALLVIMGVSSVAVLPTALLLGTGRERQQASAALAGMAVGLAALLVLAPRWGADGATAGFAAGIAVTAGLAFLLGLRSGPAAPTPGRADPVGPTDPSVELTTEG